MPVIISIGFLVALLLFVIWERRRKPSPASREQIRNGWAPRGVQAWHGLAAISICELVLAISLWINAPTPPFSGRWAWFYSFTHNSLGSSGPAIYTMAIAAALALSAIASRHQQAK